MNKEVVVRLLTKEKIELSDLNTFLTEYIYETKHKDVTIEELKMIVQLIQMRMLNLEIALFHSAKHLNLNILRVFDNSGKLLQTNVYEVE